MPPTTSPLRHLMLFQQMFKEPAVDDKVDPPILRYTNEYGQVGIWVLRPTLLVTHYEDARTVLAAEYFRKTPGLFVKHIKRFLGIKNIGLLEGREWRRHRSAILRSLSPVSVLQAARGIMMDVEQTFAASLTKKISSRDHLSPLVMEVERLMKMITIDIFSRTNLSVDLGCCRNLEASPIAEAFDFLLDSFKDRLLAPMNPFTVNYFYAIPTGRNLRHEKAHVLIRSFLGNLIQERKQAQTQPGFENQIPDILTSMLQANSDAKARAKEANNGNDDQAFDIDETIDDTLMALLFAGYDTTSITLTYAIFCVAQNPDVEKKCLDEISRGFQQCEDRDGTATNLDPQDLIYCRGVLFETLRLYPPAGITSRFLKNPIKHRGGFVSPTGCAVIIPIEIIQWSERHFELPTEFIPERWVQQTNYTDDENPMWEERPDEVETPSSDDCNHKVERKSWNVAPANRSAFLAFSSGGCSDSS